MRVYEPTSAVIASAVHTSSAGHHRIRPPNSSGIAAQSITPRMIPSSSGPSNPPVARSNWNCPSPEAW